MANRIPKVGDMVRVIKLDGYDVNYIREVTHLHDDGFEVAPYMWTPDWDNNDFILFAENEGDEYEVLPTSYDDDQLAESFSEAAAKGTSLSEYTGVAFVADGLAFKSNDQKTIESITPDTLAFEETAVDVVNHPTHYNTGKFETIELIEEVTKGYDDGFVAYCVGNTLKYLSRAPYKHGEPTEDIRKAAKYLEFALKRLEGE